MHPELARILGHDLRQLDDLFSGSVGSVRIGVVVHRFDHHAALGHHPGGNGAVDTAGEQGHAFSVGTKGQASQAVYLGIVDV